MGEQDGDARISVERRDGGLKLVTGRLRLLLDRGVAGLAIQDLGEGARLSGFAPRVCADGRELPARELCELSVEHTDAGMRIRAIFATEAALELELAIELAADWPGVVLDLAVHNRSASPVRLDALDPLYWRASQTAKLSLPGDPARLRFFRMGYQSWTPAGYVAPGRSEPRPRIPLLRDLYCGPFTPASRRGLHVSDFATTLRVAGAPGLTLGFLTHRDHLTHVSLGVSGRTPSELVARAALEQRVLEPGASARGERLWLGLDAAGEDGLETWAERCGREMGARIPEATPAAWCSWYQFFTRVGADDVVRSARRLAELEVGVDTVQLDDGFQSAVGDWLDWSPGFPDGIEPVARKVREAGFRAGLWLAPLLASRQSRTAQEHPDWLLRRADGKPRVALVNKDWKGKVCYALDPTHPGVLAALESLARRIRGFGFDYLKLDFLYAGTLGGVRHDPTLPAAAAYRRSIEAIRRGAGEDVFMVGCGAPLGPSIGLFEAMRVGPDVAPHWGSPIADRLFGVKAAPAAVNSIRNVLARASLHRRLWLNDPDCALLRDRDTRLDETEVQTLVSVIGLSGGSLVLSDDPDKLSDERRRLQARLLPPLRVTPRLLAGDAEIPEQLSARFPDGSVLVLRVNLSGRPRRMPIDPAALGLLGPVRAYDVWRNRELERDELGSASAAVPAHGCRLVRLIPDDDRARVLGSTLHLAAGAIETASVRLHPGGGAQIELALSGAHRGQISLVLPGRKLPARVHVSFRDELSLRLDPGGLEETRGMTDR